jgi:hypothetical protein
MIPKDSVTNAPKVGLDRTPYIVLLIYGKTHREIKFLAISLSGHPL